jgi:hypothetical protein
MSLTKARTCQRTDTGANLKALPMAKDEKLNNVEVYYNSKYKINTFESLLV